MASRMDVVDTSGQMVLSTSEILKTVKSTAKASGEAIVTTLPLVTMKDTTRMGKRMAMASIDGPQATYIKVNF